MQSRIWTIFETFDRMCQAGRYPVGIYPVWLRLIPTFIVPVAFEVTAAALAGSRLFWKFGPRHYSGASA